MSVPNSAQGSIFKAAYMASRDPRIQALYSIDDPQVRFNTAYTLALKGLAIDEEIELAGADPLIEMTIRKNDGLKWVESALQPNIQVALVGAQQPNPPFAPYDPDNMPEGALLVSTDPADFKPFPVPPAPPIPPPSPTTPQAGMKLVGPAKTSSLFDLTTQARTLTIADGFVWTKEDDGHVYVMHVVSFGAKIWERTS